MSKTAKIALIVAGCVILLGVVIGAVAMLFGAGFSSLLPIHIGDNVNPNVSAVFGSDSSFATIDRESEAEYISGEGYSIPAGEVQRLRIRWTAGGVRIVSSDRTDVYFSENLSLEEKYALRFSLENGELYIQYTDKNVVNAPEKQLTLELPASLSPESVFVDSASAEISVSGVSARYFGISTASGDVNFSGAWEDMDVDTASGTVTLISSGSARSTEIGTASGAVILGGELGDTEIDTASGSVSGEGITAGKFSVDTASGAVTVTGAFREISAETTSGEVSAACSVCPEALEVETASGSVTLALPKNSNFALEVDTASGSLDSELPLAMQGGRYVCGQGGALFEVETASGDIAIKIYR